MNLSSYTNIGFWTTCPTNICATISFFLSDGTNTAKWTVTPGQTIYNKWAFNNISLSSGFTGTVNLAAVTSFGWSGLVASTLYNFDYVAAWNSANDFAMVTTSGSNDTIQGLNFTHFTHTAFPVISSSSSPVTIESSQIVGGSPAISTTGNFTTVVNSTVSFPVGQAIVNTGTSLLVQGSVFHDTPFDAVWSAGSNGQIGSGNTIYRSSGNGINLLGANAIASGNVIHDIETFAIYAIRVPLIEQAKVVPLRFVAPPKVLLPVKILLPESTEEHSAVG